MIRGHGELADLALNFGKSGVALSSAFMAKAHKRGGCTVYYSKN